MSTKFYTVDAHDPELGAQLLPGMRLRVSKRTFAQIAAERFQALKAESVAFGGHGADYAAPAVGAEQSKVLFAAAARSRLVSP